MEGIKLNDRPKDDKGYYEIINGEKIYQIEEKTEKDKSINDSINEWRKFGGGLSPMKYLHNNIK